MPSSTPRSRPILILGILAAAAPFVPACTAPSEPASLPDNCDSKTGLFSPFSVLEADDHPCRPWVESVYGRAARSSNASAAVWTTQTESGAGLLVSAVHTLGVGWYTPAGQDVPEVLQDPAATTGVPRIFLITSNGAAVDDRATPMFDLYNPAIPGEENANFFFDILPRHDFFVAVVDDQKIDVSPLVGMPELLRNEPPALFDPAGLAMGTPTYAAAEPGELVMMIGFPGSGTLAGQLAASVGRVLDDDEAEQAIVDLAAAGDVEGDIAYDAEVEMLVEGEALGGMSGSGVFDTAGRLVGVLVRASDPLEGTRYIRAVRMTFIASELEGAFADLPPIDQEAVAPYVEALP